jgi:hypothetical protein
MGIGIYLKIAGYVDFDMLHIFCNLNLTFISYSFWNITRKVLFFFLIWWKKGNNSKMGTQIYFKIAR